MTEITTSKTISRLTTAYCAVEDRIRISAEVSETETVLLWMTQRLARNLVLRLCDVMEKKMTKAPMPSLQLEMKREAAASSLTRQSPVDMPQSGQGALLSEMVVNMSEETVALQFKWAGDQSAGIQFSSTALLQWFTILRSGFVGGHWPLDVWPDWMAPDPKSADATVSKPFH